MPNSPRCILLTPGADLSLACPVCGSRPSPSTPACSPVRAVLAPSPDLSASLAELLAAERDRAHLARVLPALEASEELAAAEARIAELNADSIAAGLEEQAARREAAELERRIAELPPVAVNAYGAPRTIAAMDLRFGNQGTEEGRALDAAHRGALKRAEAAARRRAEFENALYMPARTRDEARKRTRAPQRS